MLNIKIYDLLGREVADLVNNQQYQSGAHNIRFYASRLAPDVYFSRYGAGGFYSNLCQNACSKIAYFQNFANWITLELQTENCIAATLCLMYVH